MVTSIYTWEEFFADAPLLAQKIGKGKYAALLLITKGGLFLGSYLSTFLNIPVVETIGLRSYKHEEREVIEQYKKASFLLPHKLLVVDDIADSGETLKYVYDRYKADSVTLLYKPHTIFKPTFYVNEVADDTWIQFPWETEEVKA